MNDNHAPLMAFVAELKAAHQQVKFSDFGRLGLADNGTRIWEDGLALIEAAIPYLKLEASTETFAQSARKWYQDHVARVEGHIGRLPPTESDYAPLNAYVIFPAGVVCNLLGWELLNEEAINDLDLPRYCYIGDQA